MKLILLNFHDDDIVINGIQKDFWVGGGVATEIYGQATKCTRNTDTL